MKLNNQTIFDAARRQREQDMASLSVKPWPQRRRSSLPAWLVALPAAAVAGFLLGLFVRQPDAVHEQLMASADTVYITREVPVPQKPDTVVRYVRRPRRAVHLAPPQPAQASNAAELPATGRSIAEDNIDYSLLVVR